MAAPSTVAIVGAGAMGHGLAVQCRLADLPVVLIDHRQENLDRARDQIRSVVDFLRRQDLVDRPSEAVLAGTTFGLDLAAGVADADVVLETVSEDLALKQSIFADFATAAPPDAVLATNTSSLRITDIAEGALDAADRIAGCHWWFPPYLLRPVEVVRGEATAPATVDRLASFVRAVDRDPVRVERDVPGFVWNRVQFAVVRECLHIVAAGIASVEDVNRAIRDGYATRTAAIGPFETMDIAGLELFATIASDLYPSLATDRTPQEPLVNRVERGETGIETGQGFFAYDEAPDEVTRRRDDRVAAIRRALGATED